MSSLFKQTNARKFLLSFLLSIVIGTNLAFLPGRSSTRRILAAANIPPALAERPHSPEAYSSLVPTDPEIREADQRIHDRVKEVYGKLPLSFEINQGQMDSQVQFTSGGGGYKFYLTPVGAVMVLSKPSSGSKGLARRNNAGSRRNDTVVDDILSMKFIGANPKPEVVGLDQLPGKSNYFIGNDPKKWRVGVPNYAQVKYRELYPGIDMLYYGNQRQLEYDFIVAPNADARAIKLSFEGARKLRIDGHGNLVIAMSNGEVKQNKPTVYQEVEGRRREIAARYVLKGRLAVGFALGEYDPRSPLIIDPILSYSTYFSGSPQSIAIDAANNIYLTGFTFSLTFPVVNAIQPTFGGGQDVFVTKLNAAGSTMIYSTYLGGSDAEGDETHIAVDSSGNATIAGTTRSTDFPTFNPLDPTYNGSGTDAFVAKLNAAGNALIYSTFLGGASEDVARGLAVDSLGNAYVTGYTYSPNFPTLNPIQPPACNGNNTDIFLTAINSTGTAYLYSTHIGGTNQDAGLALTVGATGNVYVTGYTWSTDFPLVNPTQPTKTGPLEDAFILKVNPAGASLLFSTYLGGNVGDVAYAIALDAAENAFVTGTTESSDFPTTPNAYRTTSAGNIDAFVAKIDTVAPSVVYSTYLGGSNHDYGLGIVIDPEGCAIVAGATASTNFPVVNPIQSHYAGVYADAIVVHLNQMGSGLTFSTFLGGNGTEGARSIVLDATNTAYITGQSDSTNFPLVSPLQTAPGDGFIAKLSGLVGYTVSGQVLDANNVGMTAVTVTLTGSAGATTQTDASGYYSFATLAPGGNYTVTPSKSPYTFGPTNQTFNGLSANQTADFTVATHSISGSVTGLGGTPTSGVTVVLSGTQSNTTETDSNGNYSFPAVAKGGNYTVTPSKVDPILTYAFTPVSQSVSSLSANQIINFASSSTIISALNATADAYVQDGTGANSNFGTVSNLKVEKDSKTNNSKNFDAYFKFDVSGVAGNITSVKLRIFAASSTAAGATTAVYSVSNTSWVESGAGSITWNNKPAPSPSPLAGATATVNSTTFTSYDLDVTAYVKGEKNAGRDVISLALHNPSSSTVFINLNSREASANKPQLIATVGTNPNAAPSVNLTSPAAGAPFTSPATITVSANATDSDGTISKVEFYAGTNLIGATTSPPYQISWGSVAAGNYSLTAVATDNFSAATTSAAVPVLVSLPNSLPTVSLSSPLEGTTLSAGSNITISANASDSNGTITKVEFFAGTTLIGTATTPGSGTLYSVVWNNVNSGAYVLTAKATDNTTATTTSAPVNINVVAQTGLSPTADAYVRDGASATTNFGTAATLQTQASATAGNNRESYLKFDLTTVTVINKATVRLYGSLSDATGSNVPTGIYSVATTTWIESGSGSITWNTKPAAGAIALATTVISDNVQRWYEFDVTAYLKAEKILGHNIVSLVVKNTAQSSPFASFNSREAVSNRPQLILWSTQPRNALLVVASTNLNTGDNAIKTRLQNLGFTVTVKAAGGNPNSAILTSDADGKTLVLISSTVTPANVTNKFRNVTVPVLTWESGLFDYQGMTEAGFGTMNSQTDVVINNSSHPLAAGLSGTQTVAASGSFSWGTPTANAARIATLSVDATKFVIFGYDNTVAMPGLLDAPARRVGLFLTDTTAASFTVNVNGGLLFDAAVKWASELVTAPFINSLTPTSGPLGTVVTIRGGNFGSTQGTSTVTFNGVAATPTVWGYSSVTVSVPVFATTGPVVITVGGVASNAVTFAVGDSDSDGDGLPDWWELQYFGNLNQNGSGDADGDGLTNLQEYQQGRNPTKSALADNGDFVNLKLYTPLAAPSP